MAFKKSSVLTVFQPAAYLYRKTNMDDIRAWLSGSKDWNTGIILLEKYHRNKFFVKNFRLSNPVINMGKLEYELKKLLGIPLSDIFNKVNITKLPVKQITIVKEPKIITLAKEEIYNLYTKISIAHRHLFELGESNAAEVTAKRKQILDERAPLIKRYEKIYLLKEEYFKTGVIPVELPSLLEKGDGEQDKKNGPVKKGDNQNKFAALSDIELVKKEHALRVSIGKLKNRLAYQSLSKGETPNPMPEGPLREKLFARLSAFEADIESISNLITERK
ncbi:hypothetical protein LJC68_08970 [Bacteroidales bacterium OttesenSCG-928-B11]|nr:hypothetical protein [Bacteroidales bacterium OttesenSCG-928-C03]MDL2312991.1 hypothetical protein [Bacteroidales bacterium OttesenSCG-928-B11]